MPRHRSSKCYIPPAISAGDWVVPNGNYSYSKWPMSDPRQVKEVVRVEDGGHYVLRIWNPFKIHGAGYSLFNPDNFRVAPRPEHSEDQEMAIEKTNDRFFAIKLNMNTEDLDKKQEDVPHLLMKGKAENGGFWLADVNHDHEADATHYDTTPLRDSRTKVTNDVRDVIQHGDRWVICEAIAFIDGEPPRPPIKLVELR